jgi:hypothetical protein
MPREPIPDEVRRFILTSVPSVPFVEAMLMFMGRRGEPLENSEVARRLYVSDAAAAEILRQLGEARIVQPCPGNLSHRYAPDGDLGRMLDQVRTCYARDLIGVTDLIHSRSGRKAQQFADAFKLRKDS